MAKEQKTGRAQVGLRVSEDMRRRLETAAKSNDRSINAEILERLGRSFDIEDRLGGPRVVEMTETIATVMRSTGERAGFLETGRLTNQGEWLSLPYSFDQAAKAANVILKHYKPKGKIVVPEPRVVHVVEGGDPEESKERVRRILEDLGPLAEQIRKQEEEK